MSKQTREILEELFMSGLGTAGLREEKHLTAEEVDKGILNSQRHYVAEAEAKLDALIQAERLEVLKPIVAWVDSYDESRTFASLKILVYAEETKLLAQLQQKNKELS